MTRRPKSKTEVLWESRKSMTEGSDQKELGRTHIYIRRAVRDMKAPLGDCDYRKGGKPDDPRWTTGVEEHNSQEIGRDTIVANESGTTGVEEQKIRGELDSQDIIELEYQSDFQLDFEAEDRDSLGNIYTKNSGEVDKLVERRIVKKIGTLTYKPSRINFYVYQACRVLEYGALEIERFNDEPQKHGPQIELKHKLKMDSVEARIMCDFIPSSSVRHLTPFPVRHFSSDASSRVKEGIKELREKSFHSRDTVLRVRLTGKAFKSKGL